MLLKIGETNVWVSNSLDQDEMQVTRHLIRIKAVCIWDFGCAWWVKVFHLIPRAKILTGYDINYETEYDLNLTVV